jgi:hypothetical protein
VRVQCRKQRQKNGSTVRCVEFFPFGCKPRLGLRGPAAGFLAASLPPCAILQFLGFYLVFITAFCYYGTALAHPSRFPTPSHQRYRWCACGTAWPPFDCGGCGGGGRRAAAYWAAPRSGAGGRIVFGLWLSDTLTWAACEGGKKNSHDIRGQAFNNFRVIMQSLFQVQRSEPSAAAGRAAGGRSQSQTSRLLLPGTVPDATR